MHALPLEYRVTSPLNVEELRLKTLVSGSNSSTYTPGISSMMQDLNCTYLQAIAGLSVYTLGFAVLPLLTMPLSEELGRRPLYIVSALVLVIMGVMIGL